METVAAIIVALFIRDALIALWRFMVDHAYHHGRTGERLRYRLHRWVMPSGNYCHHRQRAFS